MCGSWTTTTNMASCSAALGTQPHLCLERARGAGRSGMCAAERPHGPSVRPEPALRSPGRGVAYAVT
jgi:hypothetical protein